MPVSRGARSAGRSIALVAALAAIPAVITSSAVADHGAAPRWIRANFHAHAASAELPDDGAEQPAALHALAARRGFQFSAHTPHSTLSWDEAGGRAYQRARAAHAAMSVPGCTVAVGQELTVAPGPNFRDKSRFLGHEVPGNLDHLTLLGGSRWIGSGSSVVNACRFTHADGGICIVNHPGPGPMMWEEGLWEAPENRHHIDAIEVYNGQGLALAGIDFEDRYLEATAYRHLGMRVAAVTGTDTHGPDSHGRTRRNLRDLGLAVRLLRLVAGVPEGTDRPELAAATYTLAPSSDLPDVLDAVRARRTVATWAFDASGFDMPRLGQVVQGADVALHARFGRTVDRVILFREGSAVQVWERVESIEWREAIDRPAAYVLVARDGGGRLMTSATWFEPPAADAGVDAP